MTTNRNPEDNTQGTETHSFSPISCPSCESRRFTVIPPQNPNEPVHAKCFETDCGYIYPLTNAQVEHAAKTTADQGSSNSDESNGGPVEGTAQPPEQSATSTSADRAKAKPPKDKRSYNGSKVELLLAQAEKDGRHLSIAPQRSRGVLEAYTDDLLFGGPDALVKAQHHAAKLSARFGEEFAAEWLLETDWLKSLKVGHRGCERAKYALQWRPKYLALLALSGSHLIASKGAKVAHLTALNHRKEDVHFSAQCDAAKEYAIQLFHDACFKSALEGDCEPVYWQGIKVGHIRKYDSRLRIEMLRAHMPNTFKAPGGNTVNVDARQQTVMFTPEMQQEVQGRRRAALERMQTMEINDKPEKRESIDELIRRSSGHAMPPITIADSTGNSDSGGSTTATT